MRCSPAEYLEASFQRRAFAAAHRAHLSAAAADSREAGLASDTTGVSETAVAQLWRGKATPIGEMSHTFWPLVHATQRACVFEPAVGEAQAGDSKSAFASASEPALLTARPLASPSPYSSKTIRARRSALDFDSKAAALPAKLLVELLRAVMPPSSASASGSATEGSQQREPSVPFSALHGLDMPISIAMLGLFILNVDGADKLCLLFASCFAECSLPRVRRLEAWLLRLGSRHELSGRAQIDHHQARSGLFFSEASSFTDRVSQGLAGRVWTAAETTCPCFCCARTPPLLKTAKDLLARLGRARRARRPLRSARRSVTCSRPRRPLARPLPPPVPRAARKRSQVTC